MAIVDGEELPNVDPRNARGRPEALSLAVPSCPPESATSSESRFLRASPEADVSALAADRDADQKSLFWSPARAAEVGRVAILICGLKIANDPARIRRSAWGVPGHFSSS